MRINYRGINNRTYRAGTINTQKSVFATQYYIPMTVSHIRATITHARDSIILLPPTPTRRIMSSNGGGAYQNQKLFFSTRHYSPIHKRALKY